MKTTVGMLKEIIMTESNRSLLDSKFDTGNGPTAHQVRRLIPRTSPVAHTITNVMTFCDTLAARARGGQ